MDTRACVGVRVYIYITIYTYIREHVNDKKINTFPKTRGEKRGKNE